MVECLKSLEFRDYGKVAYSKFNIFDVNGHLKFSLHTAIRDQIFGFEEESRRPFRFPRIQYPFCGLLILSLCHFQVLSKFELLAEWNKNSFQNSTSSS